MFFDQFIASFDKPPAGLTFDIDSYDDPAHGQPQLVLSHGYYNQYQDQPQLITYAQNDQIVILCLLFGSAHPALDAHEDVRPLAKWLCAHWSEMEIILRADAGFDVPRMFDVCEKLDVRYTFGIRLNNVLKRKSAEILDKSVVLQKSGQRSQRLFRSFQYRAGTWSNLCLAIVK